MMGKIFATLFLSGISFAALAQRSVIQGQLYWLPTEANFQQNIPYQGVPLEIFVYELTSPQDVESAGNTIKRINSRLVQQAFSRPDGAFKIKVPPGQYSVFVRYKNDFFGNLKDQQGHLSPVVVKAKKSGWVTITLNYSAYH